MANNYSTEIKFPSEGAAAEWLRRSTDKERGMHAQDMGTHSHGGNECSEWSDVDGSSFDDNTCASADSPPTTVGRFIPLLAPELEAIGH